MKRKNIWTLLLLFGLISTSTSCGEETIDNCVWLDYIYKNDTPYSLHLTGYQTTRFGDSPTYATENRVMIEWDIIPSDSIKFRFEMTTGGGETHPGLCDSVRLLFDGKRELWFRKTDEDHRNLYESEHEVSVRDNHFQHIYTITEAQYDAATPIAGTTE